MKIKTILTGPTGTGKTSIGKLLYDVLHINQCSIDGCRWKYYHEIGYDENFAEFLQEKGDFGHYICIVRNLNFMLLEECLMNTLIVFLILVTDIMLLK